MELPPIGELRHLLDRLKSNDIAWFRDSFKSGKFAWLKDHLPGDGYETLGKKIEAGDLGHVKSVLGGLKLPGVDLFSGLGAGAVAGAAGIAGAATGALKGGAGAATGALKGGVGAASGAVKGGAGALKGAAVSVNDDRKKKGAIWLIPAAILGAVLLGFGLTKCNKDDKAADTVAETTAAIASDSTAAMATDSTAAMTTETSVAAAPAAASVVDVAFGDSQFSKLSAAIGAAGLTDTLKGAGPFTVLAPTDTAFNNLPAGILDKLLLPANKDVLAKILSFHVISGKVMSTDIVTGPVKSIEGTDLNFTSADGKVSVNGANVITADVAAGNGVVHAIDAVMVPASVDLTKLVADGAAAATPDAGAAAGDIVAVAAANGSFGTLVKAVEAAGLVDTLKGPGPFTVFAPTDEAFAKVDPAVLAKLLLPENKAALAKVLTYHVVAGKVMAADVKTGEVATVEGSKAALVADAGKVTIDGANVVTADVAASNGVIHVIDAVILPADLDLASLTSGEAPAAVNAAGDATPEDLTVYFDTASAAINGEGQAKIVAASRILQELPAGTKVNVIGHADSRGDAAKNQALSEARAAAVVQALKGGLGDKASNIEFASSAKGATEQVGGDQAKSRRVTIEIQK
jgi:transforming growth factor-beta-induced protein